MIKVDNKPLIIEVFPKEGQELIIDLGKRPRVLRTSGTCIIEYDEFISKNRMRTEDSVVIIDFNLLTLYVVMQNIENADKIWFENQTYTYKEFKEMLANELANKE